MMTVFVKKPRSGKRTRKLVTAPDKALTIPQILEKFSRGAEVGVKGPKPVWAESLTFDLEAVTLMDFHEKMEFAKAMETRSKQLKVQLDEEAARQKKADEEKWLEEAEKREQKLAERRAKLAAQQAGKEGAAKPNPGA